MKDNFGNELNVGDEVYFASNRGCGSSYMICKGQVVEFIKDRIKVHPTSGNYHDASWMNKTKTIILTPQKVGKVFIT